MKIQLVWTACYDIVICAPMGMRLQLPMQLFTGVVARASRSGDPLLQNPPE